MTAFHPRFPSVSFVAKVEFDDLFKHQRQEIDARYLYDLTFASHEPTVVNRGSCPSCLKVVDFHSTTVDGEVLPDGRRVPNWREQAICDCPWKLPARSRAALHFLRRVVGLSAWTRLLVVGPANPVEGALRPLVASVTRIDAMTLDGFRTRLDAEARSADVVMALDSLNHIPLVDEALVEIRRVTADAGSFVFTVPFNVREAMSSSRLPDIDPRTGRLPVVSAQRVHDFGWDIIERVRGAGFQKCEAHLYRSEEYGYLGVFNILFAAVA